MAESRTRPQSGKSCGQNSAPAFVLGNVSGGHRAHRPMKRVSPTVLGRTPKGVGVRISKNLCEQLEPVNRS
jgi:hypothetical protein